jgi:methyl-accepting chemotaxis protein
MNLSRMKISNKIMLVIALMSVLAVMITGGAVYALSAINMATVEVRDSGVRATLVARMRSNAVNLNRYEYRLAVEPYGQNRANAEKGIGLQRKQFEERSASVEADLPADFKDLYAQVQADYRAYVSELEITLRKAGEFENSGMLVDEARRLIATEADVSRELAEKLEDSAAELIEASIQRSSQRYSEADSVYILASIILGATALIGILASIFVGRMIAARGIVDPIRQVVGSLQMLASGDLGAKVFGSDRKDEVGAIASTTQVFKDNLIEAQRLRDEQEKARQDREKRQVVVNDAIQRFSSAADEVVRSVASASTELQAAADTLSQSAAEAAQQASSVAAAAGQTSANVSSVAAATEELAASVQEIGQRAQESQTVTQNAVTEVAQTNEMVKQLETAASKIGDVVNLIGDIASQTNLLALNATIEAARAGEFGRGFAVVASEVKALAEQCSTASEEIRREIVGMQVVTRSSVSAMQATGDRIGEINSISSSIAAAVEQQGAATSEISRNVQQASTGTAEVTHSITSVSSAASETGAAATQVQAAAAELARHSSVLDREFAIFVDVIRAA